MKILRFIIVLTVVAYVALLGYLTLTQRNLIYPASAVAPSLADAKLPGFDVVKYPSTDGMTLTGWYAPAIKRKPTLIIFHGNGGDLSQRANFARYMHDYGYGVLLTTYRGYPPEDGTPSERAVYDDASAALDFLNKHKIDNKNIVVMGASLGSGPATELALRMAQAKAPAHTLLLEVPFTKLSDPAQKIYWYLPVPMLLADRYDNISKIGRISTSLCVMAAGDDHVVPNEEARALYYAATGPRHFALIAGAPHSGVLKEDVANFKIARDCIEGDGR